MITNLLQVFYNAADMMVVSLSPVKDAVGAVGTTGSFISLITNIFIGFATGANVVVAKNIGAGKQDRVSRATHTSLAMSVVFGIVSAFVGMIVSRPVLTLMGAQETLLDLAVTYTNIYFAGIPFIATTNYLIAIFRAKGDTKTPLFVLSLSGIINVALNYVFVVFVGLSVEGVALATVTANAVSTVVLAWRLARDDGPCRFSFKKLCFDKKAFLDILHVGIPAGLQGSLFSISNMMIQSSIIQVNNTLCPPGSAYDAVVNGNAAAANLDGFVYTAQNSVYQGAITFTSQNNGAKKYERIYRIMWSCYILGTLIALVTSAVIFLARDPLLSLYGVKDAAEGTLEHIAYNTAMVRMYWVSIPYFVISYMEIGSGVVRGLGKSVSSTVISLLGACLLRVVWLMTIFKAYPTLEMIYLSYPVSWVLTGTVLLLYSIFVLKKYIKHRDDELPAPRIQ
jgi:putative MATE family efflux protein